MCGQKTGSHPLAAQAHRTRFLMEAIVCRFDMSDWSLNMGGKPSPRAGSQREKTLAEARNYSPDEINVNDYFRT